jgi:hypothetical protein
MPQIRSPGDHIAVGNNPMITRPSPGRQVNPEFIML